MYQRHRFKIAEILKNKPIVILDHHAVVHALYDGCKVIQNAKAKDVKHVTINQCIVYKLPLCFDCFPRPPWVLWP